jgi:hypothetical protein
MQPRPPATTCPSNAGSGAASWSCTTARSLGQHGELRVQPGDQHALLGEFRVPLGQRRLGYRDPCRAVPPFRLVVYRAATLDRDRICASISFVVREWGVNGYSHEARKQLNTVWTRHTLDTVRVGGAREHTLLPQRVTRPQRRRAFAGSGRQPSYASAASGASRTDGHPHDSATRRSQPTPHPNANSPLRKPLG